MYLLIMNNVWINWLINFLPIIIFTFFPSNKPEFMFIQKHNNTISQESFIYQSQILKENEITFSVIFSVLQAVVKKTAFKQNFVV